ncbi:hypothetical protein J6590_106130 [Homalodisca vitripennis]|nr:hypothetical protein J6590_106130 [Homalodisca vitripennis]
MANLSQKAHFFLKLHLQRAFTIWKVQTKSLGAPKETLHQMILCSKAQPIPDMDMTGSKKPRITFTAADQCPVFKPSDRCPRVIRSGLPLKYSSTVDKSRTLTSLSSYSMCVTRCPFL